MGYITLLSDIGLQDASVAVAKGILMQQCPACEITDISHDIAPFNIRQAAYLLGATYSSFPAGTCHLVLFDLFPGREPALLLSEHKGQYFLHADNGCVPLALGSMPEKTWQCTTYKNGNSFHQWVSAAGEIINALQTQGTNIEGLMAYTPKSVPANTISMTNTGTIECEVIHIDRYENVILNVTREHFETTGKGGPFRLQFVQVEEINEISSSYNDVRQGYKLCRFNSKGHLEICINRGKAASLFGLRLGSRNNDIKLLFE